MKKAKKTVRKTSAAVRGKTHPKPARPVARAKATTAPKARVEIEPPDPKKLKLSKDDATRYRKLLLDLRDHLIDGVNFLATDNLKRSQRDASGELSGYSLHMADAGTDNFDREFALSLVSNEQEALYEIVEALKRLEQGTYGLCGMCERPIRKERLEAVPFARLCITCQSNVEKQQHGPVQPAATFSETAEEEGAEAEEAGE